MTQLPFSLSIIDFLADHRSAALTQFFYLWTEFGDVSGYLLIIIFIHSTVDKRLAIRLTLIVALSSILNNLLKIAIKNPRPFVQEGTYLERWGIPTDAAKDVAKEYSTPSGHAMAAASFYGFLFYAVGKRSVRIFAVLAVVLIGLSRPYLGVHYVEDVLVGWGIGFSIALLGWRYANSISVAWGQLRHSWQILVTVVACVLLVIMTLAINDWHIDGQTRALLGYAGIVTGIVIAGPLELKILDFDPKSSPNAAKYGRFLLSVGLTVITLVGLGMAFAAISDKYSISGHLLQYIRHVLVSVVFCFVAPWLFIRIGLAKGAVKSRRA